MSLVLFLWIRRNGLSDKYGFRGSTLPAGRYLYYLPLAVIASASLWGGISLKLGIPGTLCYVLSMACAGFLEEVIFRGLLFRAMEKDGRRSAVIVSSLAFGIGHIVNLVNGSGRDLISSLFQILFAVLVGLVLVLIFSSGGSLIPCILFHSANNCLTAFGSEGGLDPGTQVLLNVILIVLVLGGYLLFLSRSLPQGAEDRQR